MRAAERVAAFGSRSTISGGPLLPTPEIASVGSTPSASPPSIIQRYWDLTCPGIQCRVFRSLLAANAGPVSTSEERVAELSRRYTASSS
jgi:hypothetical protein